MSLFNWVKKEVILQLRLALTNLKIIAFFTPIYLISQAVFYLYFRNSLYENGFWIIVGPMLVTLAFLLPYLWTKRNKSNYEIYYFLHPTLFIKIAVLLLIPFLVWLFLYAQCREYAVSIGVECIQKIVSAGK